MQDALDQKNEEAFADAEHLSTYNSAQMFANEFDRVDETHPNDDIYTEAVETEAEEVTPDENEQ